MPRKLGPPVGKEAREKWLALKRRVDEKKFAEEIVVLSKLMAVPSFVKQYEPAYSYLRSEDTPMIAVMTIKCIRDMLARFKLDSSIVSQKDHRELIKMASAFTQMNKKFTRVKCAGNIYSSQFSLRVSHEEPEFDIHTTWFINYKFGLAEMFSAIMLYPDFVIEIAILNSEVFKKIKSSILESISKLKASDGVPFFEVYQKAPMSTKKGVLYTWVFKLRGNERVLRMYYVHSGALIKNKL